MLYSYLVEPDGQACREWSIGAEDGLARLAEADGGGAAWPELIVDEDRPVMAARQERLRAGQHSHDEVRLLTATGNRRIRLLAFPQRVGAGRRRVIGAAVDITQAAAAEDLSNDRDLLTGLANNLAFQDELQSAISASAASAASAAGNGTGVEAGSGGPAIAVLSINLNAYNEIALNFDVPAADSAAVEAARRLLWIMPAGARLARLHTDEFACFMSGLSGAEVGHLAQAFLAALDAPLDIHGIQVSAEPVIGAASYPGHGDLARHLVRRAGIAAVVARSRGEAWRMFEMNRDTVERNLSLMQDLRDALNREGELRQVYQVQVDLASGRIQGVEALLRWQHPKLGLVAPSHFLPQAEATRLIQDLFRWTLAAALAVLRHWRGQRPDLCLALNLSGRNIGDPDLSRRILAALEEAQVPPSALKLEITETAMIANEAGIAHLRDLIAEGVGISLDDFGTGYSSLSYLQKLPITEIKIDRSFVTDIDTNAANRRLATLIVNIAEEFGLHTVAEGVESAAAADCLRAIGCRSAQGYHFGRPLPLEELDLDRSGAGPGKAGSGQAGSGGKIAENGAAERNRTSDPVLTKDVLYP